jgi:hypothetical protein
MARSAQCHNAIVKILNVNMICQSQHTERYKKLVIKVVTYVRIIYIYVPVLTAADITEAGGGRDLVYIIGPYF